MGFVLRELIIVGIALLLLSSCGGEEKPKTDQPKNKIEQAIAEEKKAAEKRRQEELERKRKLESIDWPVIKDEAKYLARYAEENPENKVKITTRYGDMIIKLYDDTPLHRANFIQNVKYGLYENTIFYRVVKDFMVQGGNSDFEETQEKRKKIKPYYIPSEVKPHHIHKYGSVAMAMTYTDNPEMESAQYSFYIVTGEIYTPARIKATEMEYKIDIPADDEKVYMDIGGTPHLDGVHTVFGEVIEGFDVLEKIENTEVGSSDWPVEEIFIQMEIIE